MADYLEAAVDKFTFRVATDRLYSSEGIWALAEADGRVRLGLTDFLQQHSGDVAFVTAKPVGTQLAAGDEFVEMETIKMSQGLITPLAGTLAETNPALAAAPEIVNQDPYGQGWLALVTPTNWSADRTKLMDARAYLATMQSQIDQELKRK